MKHELRLTDIGEGLEEAEIIAWLVEVGDEVARDQPIVEVMTDKSNAELPAPSAGTIVELGEAEGSMVQVGALLAVIQARSQQEPPAETVPRPTPAATSAAQPSTVGFGNATDAESTPAPPDAPQSEIRSRPRPKASPSTRRAAAERGIDLGAIVGTGPGGRILITDLDQHGSTPDDPAVHDPAAPVGSSTSPQRGAFSAATASEPATTVDERANPAGSTHRVPPTSVPTAAPASTPSPAAGSTTQPLRGVRRAIAKNMAQSWSEIPHIHAFAQIDAEPLLALRARLRGTQNPAYARLTPLGFFVASVASALRAFPQANSSLDMEAGMITTHPGINLGVAVAAPQGLVVPVLHDAGELNFETICTSLNQLIAGARDGNLAPEHYKRGTATITNFGSLGGEQATPLIRPPESVIIGFGSIAVRPFVVDEAVVARKTMHLVIGADHRLLDGDITTAVLNHIAESLRDPLGLVL